MKKKRRSLKGMTLVEVVVSMLLIVILAAMLVTAVTSAVLHMRTAKKVSDKTATQAPYAASHSVGEADGTMVLSFKHGVAEGNMTVDKYYIKQGESIDEKSGNFRYFEYVEVTTPAPVTP